MHTRPRDRFVRLFLMTALIFALPGVALAGWQPKTQLEYLYLPSGHRDTTYVVARLAGLDELQSRRLAYFCQAPDAKALRYSAPAVAVWGIGNPVYRQRIVAVLHSLHGGGVAAVRARREGLGRLIAESDKTDEASHWKIGFLIHAFGDSYAHVRPTPEGDVAYGSLVGHGFDRTVKPDYIGLHAENYAAYVRHLFTALNSGRGDQARLEEFIATIHGIVAREPDYKNREKEIEKAINSFAIGNGIPPEDAGNAKWSAEIQGVSAFLRQIKQRLP